MESTEVALHGNQVRKNLLIPKLLFKRIEKLRKKKGIKETEFLRRLLERGAEMEERSA